MVEDVGGHHEVEGRLPEGQLPDAAAYQLPLAARRRVRQRAGTEIEPGHRSAPSEPAHEPTRPAARVEDAEDDTGWRVPFERSEQEGVEAPIPEVSRLETEDAVVLAGIHGADDTASDYLRQRRRSAGVTVRVRRSAAG